MELENGELAEGVGVGVWGGGALLSSLLLLPA